jgi:hypothetical protein
MVEREQEIKARDVREHQLSQNQRTWKQKHLFKIAVVEQEVVCQSIEVLSQIATPPQPQCPSFKAVCRKAKTASSSHPTQYR